MHVVIDRPKGFVKSYPLEGVGDITETYPTDYGYVEEYVNPEDGEPVDVFVGSDKGPENDRHHGRFQKGTIDGNGTWSPDETKWFVNCSPWELAGVVSFWNDSRIIRDLKFFSSVLEVEVDIQRHCRRV